MPANFLEALMGMHVDLSGLEDGLKKAEQRAEQSTSKIAGGFNLMAAGIATAIAGTVLVALEKSISTTAEWGLEMEHLGDRMGMTAQEAATLVGVMERFGVNSNVAARSMQMLAMESKQTADALDPLHTRLGKVLGTLRDSTGNLLNMNQMFDLARQKVLATADATQQLQIAQQIFGTRMGGQMLPILKLSNDEWERQKSAVMSAEGDVNAAAEAALKYKEASAALEQSIRGLEVSIGTALLPALTKTIDAFASGVNYIKDWRRWLSDLGGNIDKTSTDLQKLADAAGKPGAAAAAAKPFTLAGLTPDELEKYGKASTGLAKEMEAAQKMGLVTANDRVAADQRELEVLREQRRQQEELLAGGEKGGLDPQQRVEAEKNILQYKVQEAQIVSKQAVDQYHTEELQAKALGLMNQQTEMQLLQQQLSDARIVGDERLKIEADLYQKRLKYEEDTMKVAVQLGAATVNQEIAFRKQKAAQLLGSGDVLGAAGEVVKARDLATQQAQEQMDFVKKLRVVSLQDEINFQRQKLEVVKGNASEEMKVIGQIADLDKQLYNQRLEYALNYVTNTQSAYDKLVAAQAKGGEFLTAAERQRNAERQERESGRLAAEVLHGGGTESQFQASQAWATQTMKTAEAMLAMGKELTDTQKDNVGIARDVLKAASGGEEVRAPGGPSPEVGSILSPIEGLATQGLARGSDIPRLDTSFVDLATRLRDTLNSNVGNLINFGTVVGDVTKKVAAITGTVLNPGAVGPGGGIIGANTPGTLPNTGGGTTTVAAPTIGPGGSPTVPSPQTGVGPQGGNDELIAAVKSLGDKLDTVSQAVSDAQNNSAAQINEAIAQFTASKSQVSVTVGVDPNSGDILTSSKLEQALAP